MNASNLFIALFIQRLCLGVFLLLFGIDKIIVPGTTMDVFAYFYGLVISHDIAYGAGALEILLILAFLAGAWKTLTYGLALLLHAVSTLTTYQELLSPFGFTCSLWRCRCLRRSSHCFCCVGTTGCGA